MHQRPATATSPLPCLPAASEPALHEALLQSEHRTLDPEEAGGCRPTHVPHRGASPWRVPGCEDRTPGCLHQGCHGSSCQQQRPLLRPAARAPARSRWQRCRPALTPRAVPPAALSPLPQIFSTSPCTPLATSGRCTNTTTGPSSTPPMVSVFHPHGLKNECFVVGGGRWMRLHHEKTAEWGQPRGFAPAAAAWAAQLGVPAVAAAAACGTLLSLRSAPAGTFALVRAPPLSRVPAINQSINQLQTSHACTAPSTC